VKIRCVHLDPEILGFEGALRLSSAPPPAARFHPSGAGQDFGVGWVQDANAGPFRV